MDTGIDPSTIEIMPYLANTNTFDDLIDNYGHGTHIAGIIASSGCVNLKIISCKFANKNTGNIPKMLACYERAIKEKVDIINLSAGGTSFNDKESEVLKRVDAAGIKTIVAAGNDAKNLGSPCWGYFPACLRLPNMTVVGALGKDGKIWYGPYDKGSNWGIPDMKWEYGQDILSNYPGNRYATMTGTSQATANFTKHLVQSLCHQ